MQIIFCIYLHIDFSRVCSDKATGAHYGVPTCEGCKVDFLINRFDMKKHIDASSRAFSNEVY